VIAVTRNPFGELIKDELEQISQRQEELKKLIENQSKEVRPLLIHPKTALWYRKAIKGFRKSLKDGKASEAKENVRALIEKILLTPKEGRKEVSIDFYGDLAGIPKIASEDKIMNNAKGLTKRLEKNAVNDNIVFEPSLQLVAGTGFEPMTFGL